MNNNKLLQLLQLIIFCTEIVQTVQKEINKDSVVLITGCAGFIGMHLVRTLYNLYDLETIICVDTIAPSYLYVDVGDLDAINEGAISLFEFKRQRFFALLQNVPSVKFYTTDIRPTIPEYFDVGEVSILTEIIKQNEISHVVHLADSQVIWQGVYESMVPRDDKVGMMELLLEAIQLLEHQPKFVYASSYEVYDSSVKSNSTQVMREDDNIKSPMSLHGGAKLADEILAETYYNMKGIPSVGLRFFPVYGPWSSPGFAIFEMAERAVNEREARILELYSYGQPNSYNKFDVVYIDDAVDAILSAMHLEYDGGMLTVNVGTGEPKSLEDIATFMESYFPRTDEKSKVNENIKASGNDNVVMTASLERAKEVLGWEPQVSFEEGFAKTLAWHFDRAYPQGIQVDDNKVDKIRQIAKKGIASCNPYDLDCLNGSAVFPCKLAECANPSICTSSIFDESIAKSISASYECESVLYTVALEEDVETLPAAGNGNTINNSCYIAFVSETSTIYQNAADNKFLHGAWKLVPVQVKRDTFDDEDAFEKYINVQSSLPKLSPGSFFSNSVKIAVYADPNIILIDLNSILKEIEDEIVFSTANGGAEHGDTETSSSLNTQVGIPALILPKRDQQYSRGYSPVTQQENAYNKIRILMKGNLMKKIDGVDSNAWMVHRLDSSDARMFRCDVLAEVLQWEAEDPEMSLNFVIGLHDLWSRILATFSSLPHWWVNDISSPEETKQTEEGRRYPSSSTSSLEGTWKGIISSTEKQTLARLIDSVVHKAVKS